MIWQRRLLLNSYQIARNASSVVIDIITPIQFAGSKGVRFIYTFSKPNETLQRRGEARGAVVGWKLYLVAYEAPSLYYYDRSAAQRLLVWWRIARGFEAGLVSEDGKGTSAFLGSYDAFSPSC